MSDDNAARVESMLICANVLPLDSLQFNPTKGDEVLHPQFRARPKSDFEGDTNPETGEVGGPKKDPLKNWQNEWTYGGRTYDF